MDLYFGDKERTAARQLIALALEEDFASVGDITTKALIPADQTGAVNIVAREKGVLAGLPVALMVLEAVDESMLIRPFVRDGKPLVAGTVIAEISGKVRSLFAAERTCLNFLTHLSGVATLTRRYVDAIAGTKANIYDTRKTLPGWRVLQKYAVCAGGGRNHRMGLSDMALIKDNHLAGWQAGSADKSIAAAVRACRERTGTLAKNSVKLEVEVDSLDQLVDALGGAPDIVLLDNMTPDNLRAAVAARNTTAPAVELEASGGVNLATVAAIAATGVERISVGALTHSVPALDLAFDWK